MKLHDRRQFSYTIFFCDFTEYKIKIDSYKMLTFVKDLVPHILFTVFSFETLNGKN